MSVMAATRVCSLLPSATEIVSALGATDRLVAVTHECDYPAAVAPIPKVTSSVVDSAGMTEAEIDEAIKRSLANLSTIYFIDKHEIARLQPDLIITQQLCEVCAVSFDRVCEVAESVCPGAKVLSLEPDSLDGIFATIEQVGAALGVGATADNLTKTLKQRCQAVATLTAGLPRPSLMAVEWLDPPYTAGHWVPEMIEIAGGESILAQPGTRSRQTTWQEIAAADPDCLVLMPCGYDLAATIRSIESTSLPSVVGKFRALDDGRVYAVDGSAYFNRPGPRVVDGIELLASIIHPDVFPPLMVDRAARIGREQLSVG